MGLKTPDVSGPQSPSFGERSCRVRPSREMLSGSYSRGVLRNETRTGITPGHHRPRRLETASLRCRR
jgi:hypothetical protein